MKVKSSKKYNDLYNDLLKRVMAASMAFVIPFSLASCKNKDSNEYENVTTISSSDYEDEKNDNYLQKEIEEALKSIDNTNASDSTSLYVDSNSYDDSKSSYNEINENDVISKIKNVEYKSNVHAFNDYDIYKLPSEEMNIINSQYDCSKIINNNINYNYSWCDNGSINEDALYNKIIQNNKNNNIDINDNIKELTKLFSRNLSDTISVIKKYDANYNFSSCFKNIDNLTICELNNDDFYSYYGYDDNMLYCNLKVMNLDNCADEVMNHEQTHIILNNCDKNDPIYSSGCALDAKQTKESPLELKFINEYFAQNVSVIINKDKKNNYNEEYEKIKIFCLATGISENDLFKLYLSKDPNKLTGCFENELRDFNYVWATISGLNMACGYGYFPDNVDSNTLRGEFQNFSKVNLLKNYYIKIIKQIKNGIISKEEADILIDNMTQYIKNTKYNYSDNKNLYDTIDCIDSIYKSLFNVKTK